MPSSWPSHLGGQLWPADQGQGQGLASAHGQGPSTQTLPSGHAALDASLTGGGWPSHALIEALQTRGLHAEWRLMLAAVRTLQTRGAHVLLVAPPFTPYLPGLARQGLNPATITWVQARTSRDIWWALEQSLRCQALTAVLGWCPDPEPAATRRLQLAATRHDGLCCLFRPVSAATQASAAPLRVVVRPADAPGELQVKLLKQRGRAATDWLPMSPAAEQQGGWARLLAEPVPPSPVAAPLPLPAHPPAAAPTAAPLAWPTPVASSGALDALLDRLSHS